ncbi:hypothetical protein BCR39DRAFT_545930 [Naematelia encephala]|uniref:Uncharacterized protein n=1 Tax=Naematelia encephala TaxID=71784 RepID=A0A1Y2AS42_9TREE|nr:hypothetical protein BCR39DRAFT_545930 [Naematelia encephala]
MQNGQALVEMTAQGPGAAGPSVFSTPPRTSPRNSSLPQPRALDPEDGFLGTIARWSDAGPEDGAGFSTARTSHLIGLKGLGLSPPPPPPPGPPPSEPPPLPPSASHPFATHSRTSSGVSRASGRMSTVNAFRKAPNTPPSHPPPAEGLPPTPTQSSSSSPLVSKIPLAPGQRTRHPSLSSNVTKRSSMSPPSSPQFSISPRTTSLLNPSQLAGAGEASSSSSVSGSHRVSSNQLEHHSPPARRSDSSKPPRTPSRHLLQSALDLAQKAVEMDKNNDVLGALAAYREAVARLKSVMERVGVEPTREDGRRRRSTVGKSEEEGRTLRGIHDAYVARIQLLSSYEGAMHAESSTAGALRTPPRNARNTLALHATDHPSTSTSILVPAGRNDARAVNGQPYVDENPRPSMEEGAYGIGNLMLATSDQSFDESLVGSSPPVAGRPPREPRTRVSSGQLPPTTIGERPPSLSTPLDFEQPDLRRRASISLQEALDEVANNASSSSIAPIIPPPRRQSITAASIGLGRPNSNPVFPPGPSSRPVSQETRTSSWRRPSQPSVGIETELSLDGRDDGVEVLAKSPHGPPSPFVEGSMGRSDSLPLTRTESSGSSAQSRHRLSAKELVDRPLPPLPNSAPVRDSTGQLRQDMSSQRPPSGSGFMVSNSTTQGTISQRRQSRLTEGMASISEMASPPRPDIEGLPRSTAFPFDSGHQRAVSSPSLGHRVRAISHPGHRTSQSHHQPSPSEGDLPPLPALPAKAPFLSQTQTKVPIGPDKSNRLGPGVGPGLRIDTYSNSQGLAPPISIHSQNDASLGSRSLPPLSGVNSVGSGSLISPVPETQPSGFIHRPFHLLRILCLSMDPESSGSYLTGAIHISSAVWKPSNWAKTPSSSSSSAGTATIPKPLAPPKILAQDIKVRVIEALCMHNEIIRQTGAVLLDGPRETRYGAGGRPLNVGAGANVIIARAEEFVGVLEGLDEEMEASYKLLMKAGVGVGSWKGKGKKNGSALSWGSRITKTMDKMTNNKAMDSPDKYVDLLSNLCYSAQVIDEHLSCFTGPCTPAYHVLPEKLYRQIESRITRTAEFVGAVVVPFILDDFKQFFLRYLKGGVRYLED